MPVGRRHLRGENRGTALIPIVTEFQEVAALAVFQRGHGKVIQHQNVDTRKPQQQAAKLPSAWATLSPRNSSAALLCRMV